jgi:hypothetical protein
VHNAEVRDATLYLFEKLIPRFAVWLEGQEARRLKELRLSEAMHREGINMCVFSSNPTNVCKVFPFSVAL